ncbi:Arogenate dehydrogenase [Methylocella silvestris BL2]|uniref:prephenate dehydrogenase n=1 Tax=Methylocella silvestris (strain DSM 15510 / CIP 108128 / LMG 27833 / NCIMB 13906 / BL2) TaxID=395965 RepID=B8EPH3_METSB|nr:prephenate/arogenate dehydrogenase family protein [Methylocella silvestris]ACK50178.1 Arogenate dehydrogenase [Methylocella silvestris BL2]
MPDGLGPALEAPLFESAAIIGVGLIGSSLARIVRRKGLARRIIAFDSNAAVRRRALEIGLADHVPDTLGEAVAGADLVVLCAPVGAMEDIARDMAPHLADGTIVSDVGSVKAAVIAALAPLLPPNVHLIPAHPVAGTEESGPDAGFASLFYNRWTIVTPPDDADPRAVAKLIALWKHAGANVEIMSAAHHDLVLAITSHVPHLIAYNIVGTAADLEEVTQSEVIKFSAGGFRDFTRIAASDPVMWRDIFLANKDAVLEMLGRFSEDLTALQRMIRRGDGEGLQDLFARTRAIRRSIIDLGQETAAPDFGRRAKADTEG